MNKQYNFTSPFIDYDDKPLMTSIVPGVETSEKIMMNKTLSGNLKVLSKGDIIKIDDWARALHKGQSLVLDNADRNELERIIKDEFVGMSITIKRQLLDVLANGQEIKLPPNGTSGNR